MIEQIYLLFEICAYLIIVNDLHGKKFKVDLLAVIVISVEVIIFQLTNQTILPNIFRIIPYTGLFIYMYVEFSTTIKKMVVNMLIAMSIVGGLQILFCPFFAVLKDEDISVLVINILTCFLSCYLVNKGTIRNIIEFIIKYSKEVFFVVFNCIVLLGYTVIYFKILKRLSVFEYILLLAIYILIVFLICIWKRERENVLKKEKEVDFFSKYSDMESAYIEDIRKRQHEFKNQISALYSIYYTCSSYEELVEKQKKYAELLIENNAFNDVVLACKDSIMAGFIITKLVYAKKMELM